MAYIVPNEDDDEQKKAQEAAPTLAPGAVSTGADGPSSLTGAPSGGTQKQQTPQEQSGSGFTNLSSWLNAGAGRDKQISDTGGGLLTAEKTKYDTAAKPLRDATFTATTFNDNDLGIGSGPSTGSRSSVTYMNPADDPANAWKDKLKGALTQDYNGPMSVDYDPSKGESADNLRGVDALAATDTTGAELAKREGTGVGGYTAGQRRLDNTLFGADTASQAAIAGNKAAGDKFLTDTSTESANLAGKAAGFKADAAAARDKLHGQLQGSYNQELRNLDNDVKFYNDRESQNALTMPTTGAGDGQRFTGGYEAGVAANRNNVATPGTVKSLNDLASLLGTSAPTITPGGEHTSGHWYTEQDPDKVPMLNATNSDSYTFDPNDVDPDARRNADISDTLLGIFTGGLGNIISHATTGRHEGTSLYDGHHGRWHDQNGNVADVYDRNPTTGIVTDRQTGEKFLQSDIDAGNVRLNPETGKYEVVISGGKK